MAVCAGSSSTILRESRSYRLWSSGPTNPTTKQEKAAPSRQIITAELCGNEVALHELLSGWGICLHMLVYATHDFNHIITYQNWNSFHFVFDFCVFRNAFT